ncbi:hypothetical protein LTR86_007741 [Recurvomyces mirabilis]|nr:hypothetical protein LTR86_007741 [Recurvomyces mirabilis]
MVTFGRIHIESPWAAESGMKTGVQRFLEGYISDVDKQLFTTVPMTRWYSAEAVFHAQDGKDYLGAESIGSWMRGTVFGAFEKVTHDLNSYYEISGADEGGSSLVFFHAMRRVFLKGNLSEQSDVVVPLLWLCRVGKADSEVAPMGLQLQEVWMSWDTGAVLRALKN